MRADRPCSNTPKYPDFLRVANKEQRTYFAFAGTRNPMDVAVTRYHKLRSDHGGEFSGDNYRANRGGHVVANTVRQFQAIQERNLDFSEWFRIVSRYPFDSRGSPEPADFDALIRFEHLQEDYSKVLRHLGITQIRPIPSANRTAGRDSDWLRYYPPELRARAKVCFGPYMRRWGYEFPEDWGTEPLSSWNRVRFSLARAYRRVQHRRISPKSPGQLSEV